MKILLNCTLLVLILISCEKKSQTIANPSLNISTNELKNHVYKLASDELEGRGAGYPGEKQAALYIAKNFKSNGLLALKFTNKNLDDYLQPFDFQTIGSDYAWETLKTQNVMGLLKGDLLPEEYIVVGGHHDGQGKIGQADFGRNIVEIVKDSVKTSKDSIWNSAVDNAVSISAIMEMVRVLNESDIQLKRSIIFTTFSAEESGLNGSVHFVNDPPVPIEQIKAMVNLEKIVGDPDAEFLYVSYDTHPMFEELRKEADSIQPVNMIPFYSGIIADTDHYPFTQRKIPAITMGTGSEINIHTALDHAKDLDYDLLRNRTDYILSYLIQLANSDSSFNFEGDLSGLLGVSGGLATEREKDQKGFKGDIAFKITAVVRDSKGHIAGLLPGDLIIEIDNSPVKFQNYYLGLEDFIDDINQKTMVLKIIRGNKETEKTIQLK